MGLPVSAIPRKAHHYALVRRCDVCGKVNAIDLDGSTENEQAMQEVDHTVTRMSRAEAQEAWEGAGRCDHKAIIADLRAQLAAQNAIAQTPPDSGTKNL